ncbi:helix-hairpin-helix domain-containing protein [Alteromonas aestuariivivens]|uniref:Helix-hairpin-helix domain-containing protein n=1 Tax=Alteromonas aestuariivivens TaxID=1938339 RepID=A0A3D8M441_9ALTE|nr:helix-hairpin-helix domain-containing protein [Alteromonas aestuariivivens]RDV24378.1 helix-hairpin-helix domain-containing protein [Alteromonas aestuariivivens]
MKLRIVPLLITSLTTFSNLASAATEVTVPMPPDASLLEQRSMTLNLNTASVEDLMALPGIGESKARAIIEYRTRMGGFVEVEQLTEVKGIGDKLLEKLKTLVSVY